MLNKLYSMLGIGKKAGLLALGETGCIQSIKREKSKLVIVSSDASENTKDRILSLCDKHGIKYYVIGEKQELGYALGKSLSSIISITDIKFSEAIIDIIEKDS